MIYFVYQFLDIRGISLCIFNFKFDCSLEGGFYHFPSQTALSFPTLYGYLDIGTSDLHREWHATASYTFLHMGN